MDGLTPDGSALPDEEMTPKRTLERRLDVLEADVKGLEHQVYPNAPDEH